MASSIVNFFKKKHGNKQGQGGGYEMDQHQQSQKLQRGKHGTASFRLPLYRKQSPPECTENRRGVPLIGNQQKYKSPYDVVTEPKLNRPTRSLPGGYTHQHHQPSTFPGKVYRKFSPETSIILEQSGSYENFPTIKEDAADNQHERFDAENLANKKKARAEQMEPRKRVQKNDAIRKYNQLHNHLRQPQNHNDIGQQHAISSNGDKSLWHISAGGVRQMTTSEYGSGSTEPSPINEQQPQQTQTNAGGSFLSHPHHKLQASTQKAASVVGTANYGQQNSSQQHHRRIVSLGYDYSEDDEEETSSEEDRLSGSFVQFWQHQVKMLKRDLKMCKETAEKYRSKYSRLKSRFEELDVELTRERERNISLFNQLLIANDKIVQLAQQCQQNVGNHHQNQKAPPFGMANNFGGPQSSTPFNFPINDSLQKTHGAGERQCSLREIQGYYTSSAGSEGEFGFSSPQNAGVGVGRSNHGMGQQPTLFNGQMMPMMMPMPSVNDNQIGSFLAAGGLNLSALSGLEMARSGGAATETFCLSPPEGTAANGKIINNSLNDSPIKIDLPTIQKDHNQLVEEEEEKDGFRPAAEESIIFSFDECVKISCPPKDRMGGGRLSFSSDELSTIISHRKGGKSSISATLSSSDDDMARLWRKQLVRKGDRVVFRPPRKCLIPSGANANDGRSANIRFFKRYGREEREALSKFDYLRDEKSDVSGLVSSPEKTTKE